tara:strand:- start:425 stop:715 length:291 start_codon:yes stop_codon:yes gene_type:complete
MKRTYKIISKFEKIVEIPYDKIVGKDLGDDEIKNMINEQLEEDLNRNNSSIIVEFWESLVVICNECGISLQHDFEFEDGLCSQCDAIVNKKDIVEL